MMKWISWILNAAAAGFAGAFAGYALYTCLDSRANPARYAAQSAPWFTGILFRGLITAATLLLLALIRHILKKACP